MMSNLLTPEEIIILKELQREVVTAKRLTPFTDEKRICDDQYANIQRELDNNHGKTNAS